MWMLQIIGGKNVRHWCVNRHDENLTVDLVRFLIEKLKHKENVKAVDYEGNNALYLCALESLK